MERLARGRAALRRARPAPASAPHFAAFCQRQADWLDDYALFMALCEAPRLARLVRLAAAAGRGASPRRWPRRAPQHAERIAFWSSASGASSASGWRCKAYANGTGVQIIGDVPIFVAHHSADVWAHPDLFELDADGRPTVVAGVPPDYFSATGQRWGNPLYRWDAHARDGYAWWVERMRRTFELVDIVRIDHFRGFAGYWEIPASEPTADQGPLGAAARAPPCSRPSPRALGPLPIIAEDLGVITPDVDALRKQFGFPGMRILQFAFGGDAQRHASCRTTTSPTPWSTPARTTTTPARLVGHAPPSTSASYARGYLATDGHDMHWAMIRAACASGGRHRRLPDAGRAGLPGECRMNFPGQGEGWWEWRFAMEPGAGPSMRSGWRSCAGCTAATARRCRLTNEKGRPCGRPVYCSREAWISAPRRSARACRPCRCTASARRS